MLGGIHFVKRSSPRFIAWIQASRLSLSFGIMWSPEFEQRGTAHVVTGIVIVRFGDLGRVVYSQNSMYNIWRSVITPLSDPPTYHVAPSSKPRGEDNSLWSLICVKWVKSCIYPYIFIRRLKMHSRAKYSLLWKIASDSGIYFWYLSGQNSLRTILIKSDKLFVFFFSGKIPSRFCEAFLLYCWCLSGQYFLFSWRHTISVKQIANEMCLAFSKRSFNRIRSNNSLIC